MNKKRIFLIALSFVLLIGLMLGIAIPTLASSLVVDDAAWISTPRETPLKKCTGEACAANGHKDCDYVYSFAVVGDTQNLNIIDAGDANNEYMKDLYNWILDKQDDYNIQYVLGLGDITQSYYTGYNDNKYGLGTNAITAEWANAEAAIALLNGKLGYSLVRGNHDVSSFFNDSFGKGTTYYTDLAALAKKVDGEGRPMAGFFNEDKIEDTYRKLIIGDDKYIIFTLDWFPPSRETDCTDACAEDCAIHDGLGWIDRTLKENSDYTAIITLHDFIYYDSTIVDDYEDTFPYENLTEKRKNWNEVSASGGNATPRAIWNVLRKHSNVELILCGHVDVDDINITQLRGDNGNTVTAMLLDTQTIDSAVEPVGVVGIFYMAADGKVMNVDYVSTVRDLDGKPAYLGAKNQGKITLDYSVSDTDDGWTETTYGDIITSVYNSYPFHVLLDDDSDDSTNAHYYGGYNSWNEAHTAIRSFNESHSNVAQKKAKTFYVVMSRNVTDTHSGDRMYNEARLNLTKVVLDLNDYTLTLAGDSELLRFDTGHTTIFPRYGITNGDIKITGSGACLVKLTSQSTSAGTLELSDLNITYENASAKPLITYNKGSGSADVEINITNCNIDSSKVTGAVTTLFDLKDELNNNHVTLTIKGGSIKGNTVANTVILTQHIPNDKVKLAKDSNGNYTSFTFADQGTFSHVFYTDTVDANGYPVFFELGTPTKSGSVYSYPLVTSQTTLTDYGVIPSDYANVDKYPFAIFKDGVFKGAPDFTVANAWRNIFNTTLKTDELLSGCQILLRKNNLSTGGDTWNLCYVDDVTIDLNGHTITQNASYLFHLRGRDATGHNTKITIENGKIVTAAGKNAVFAFNNEDNNTAADNFDLIFNGVTFDVSSGNGIVASFIDGNGGACGTVTLNDCVIDRGASTTAMTLFSLAESSGNKNDVKVILNNTTLKADSLENLTLATYSAEREEGKGSPDSCFIADGSELNIQLPDSYDVSGIKFALSDGNYILHKPSESENYVIRNVTTEYGDIPVEYLDETEYPFVLFKDGEVIYAFSDWKVFIDGKSGAGGIRYTEAYRTGCTLLLRRDYSTSEASNHPSYFAYIKDMTIDLGGFTFTRGDYHMFQLFGTASTAYNTELTFKNGTIKSGGSLQPFCFNNNNNNTATDHFDVIFNGIIFDVSVNDTGIINAFGDGTSQGVTANFTFNDCRIVKGSNTKTMILFKLEDKTGNKNDIKVIINGGTFEADTLSGFTFATFNAERESGKGSPDGVSFGLGAKGNAFTVKLPKTHTSPADVFAFLGNEYTVANASEDDSYAYYTVTPASITPPAPDAGGTTPESGAIPSEYADAQTYPFVIFDSDGKFLGAAKHWKTLIDTDVKGGKYQDGCTVLLRRNYDTTEAGSKQSPSYFAYINTMTIDLGGHTFTRGSNHMFQLFGTESTPHKTEITVKNGWLKATTGMAIVAYNTNDKNTAADQIDMTFEGVTFDLREITGTEGILATYGDGTAQGVDSTITLNGCTIYCKSPADAEKTATIFWLKDYKAANADYANKMDVSVIINGGKLITDTLDNIAIAELSPEREEGKGSPDSVTIKNGFTLIQTTKNIPQIEYVENGVTYKFAHTATVDGEYYHTLATDVLADDGKTVIPAYYSNKDMYPIYVNDGSNIVGYAKLTDAYKAFSNTGTYTIVLRKDISKDDNAKELGGFRGSLTIDLATYTLTVNENGNYLLPMTVSGSGASASFTVKNGTLIKNGGRGLVLFSNGASLSGDAVYTFNFDTVTFISKSNNHNKNVMFTTWEGSSTTADGTLKIVANSTFTDCVFNMRDSIEGAVMLSLNHSANGDTLDIPKDRTVHNVTIKGGKILAKTAAQINDNFAKLDGNTNGRADSIKFAANGNGDFTTLVLPSGVAESDVTSTWLTTDDVVCSFVKSTVNDTDSSYVLAVKTVYGNIPAAYAGATNNPIVIFKADKTFVGGYTAINSALTAAGLVSGGTGSAVNGADCVVLLRANVAIANTGNVSGYKNNVVIDLNGFALTASTSTCLMTLVNTATESADKTYGTVTFKNGTICYTAGGNAASVVRANGAEGIYTINFENVTLSTTNTSNTGKIYFVISTAGTSKAAQEINSTFTNCVFDYTKAQAISYAFGSGKDTDAVINATLVNCEVHAGDNNAFAFIDNGNNKQALAYYNGTDSSEETDDTLVIEGGIKLVLDNGIAAPSASNVWKLNDSIECVFVKESAGEATTTYVLKAKAIVSLDFTPKASVTLDSTLIFNIYLPAHAGLGTVTLNGETVTLGEANEGYYVISTPLMASESAEELKLVVNLTVDGTALKGSFTFSTVKYAEKLLSTAGISAAEQTLAKDMLAYINSAYVFFNGSAVAEITALLDGYTSTNVIDVANAKKTVPGLSGATFTLEAKPTVQFFFADGFSYDDFTFKVGNRTLTAADVEEKTDKYVKFALFAYEMTEVFSYTVGGDSGEYNLIAYYAYASGTGENDYKEDDKAELTDLAAKFYNYCASAKAYRQYVIANQ